jgi:hypothetical protein
MCTCVSPSAGKLAGDDKKAAKEITQAVDSELKQLPHSSSHSAHLLDSPLGDLHESSTKHLLVSLITTLNASNPDYDFSGLRAENFQREQSVQAAINSINVRHLNIEHWLNITSWRACEHDAHLVLLFR